jgi:hypothetical protein
VDLLSGCRKKQRWRNKREEPSEQLQNCYDKKPACGISNAGVRETLPHERNRMELTANKDK